MRAFCFFFYDDDDDDESDKGLSTSDAHFAS